MVHEEGRLVAAPSYLAKRGVPETPADLSRHDRLDFDFVRAHTAWPFQVGKRRMQVPTEETIRTDGWVPSARWPPPVSSEPGWRNFMSLTIW